MKINKWLMMFCMVLLSPLMLVGCGEDYSNHEWVRSIDIAEEDREVSIAVDSTESYKLQYTVVPNIATDQSVSFSSSDKKIVTVDENGNVTPVGVGSATITITSNDNANAKNTVYITVEPKKEKLSTPTGLHYDSANKKIVWNYVLTTTKFVPSYVVNLNIDGVTSQVTTPNPSLDVTEFDKQYTVSVFAKGNDVMYISSDDSQPFSFVQMDKPSDIEIISNDNVEEKERTFYLRFEKQPFTEGIEDYTLDISSSSASSLTSSEREDWQSAISPENVKTENDYIYIEIPEKLVSKQLSFTVKVNGDLEQNIYGSTKSDAIEFSQLSAPTNLSLSQSANTQLLTWSAVQFASKYKILIKYAMKDGTEEQRLVLVDSNSATPTTFDFANLGDKPDKADYNGFDIYMWAIGSDTPIYGVRYLDSAISDLPAKQQLSATEGIRITKDTANQQYKIEWYQVANASSYRVYVCPEDINGTYDQEITSKDILVYSGDESECVIGFNQTVWTVGYNHLKVVACPESESKYLESAPKVFEYSFIKLAQPQNLGVKEGILCWDAVSNASKYKIEFIDGNNKSTTVEIENVEGQKSYTYEPTTLDMSSTTTAYYVSVTAINENLDMCIDSEKTAGINVTRYGKPTKLSVANGELSWKMIDENGNVINADTVEVKLTDTSDAEIAPVFTTKNNSNLQNILEELNLKDRYFNIQLRAVNKKSTGYNFVNGEWTDAISVYQLPTPTNLRVENGVICWQAFEDSNIAPTHTGIRFELQIGTQGYGLDSDPILDINSTSAIISDLASSSTYQVKLRVMLDEEASKAGNFGNTVIGRDDTFIINSNYSETINVRRLSKPTNLSIIDSTLYWGKNSQGLNTYRVELYKLEQTAGGRVRANTPIISEEVTPSDPSNPKFDFSVINTEGFNFGAGAYQFIVSVVGNNYDKSSAGNYGYLTSASSDSLEIYKLETPETKVQNGYITWDAIYSKLGGAQQRVYDYIITIKCDDEEDVVLNVNNDLSTNFNKQTIPSSLCGKDLNISIRAKSKWTNVFDSEWSTNIVAQKQTKVDISTVAISDTKLTWADSLADNKKFYVEFYNASDLLISSVTCDKNECTLPNFAGGEYYATIQKKGYGTYLDSEPSDKILIERFEQPLGITMYRDSENKPEIKWSATQDYDYLQYKINITHTATDSTVTQYAYYTPSSVKTLNLSGTAKDKNGEEIAVADFGAGSLRITIQAVCTSDTQKRTNESGNTVYLLNSVESSVYNAYVYDAPTIKIENGIISLVKTNQFDKGVQLIFTPIDENNSNVLDNDGAIPVSLSAGVNTYDMVTGTTLSAGVKYQVKLRALGNSNNIIASSWENGDYVVEKLQPLNANSVDNSIDNASEYNGWYVRNGDIEWNSVEGASQYVAYITDVYNKESIAFSVNNDKSITTYVGKMDNITQGKYGLRFKLIGGETDNTITLSDENKYKLGYVSSDLSTTQEVFKLYAPNNYYVTGREMSYSRIVNGEFDWGVRDDNSNWVDCIGVTAYRVSIDDENTVEIATNFVEKEGQSGDYPQGVNNATIQSFDAKEHLLETEGTYRVKIYSIGNSWRGTFETNKIYLTSDAYSEFDLINGGLIDDLAIKGGKLQWDAASKGSQNGYEITYTYENNSNINTETKIIETTSYSFDGADELKGKTINNIKVRHAGDKATGRGLTSGYINTVWSAEMNNIIKLPDIEKTTTRSDAQQYFIINDYGQLQWTYGAQYLEGGSYSNANLKMHLWLDITYLSKSVGGNSTGWDIDKPNTTYDVPTIEITQEQIKNAVGEDETKGVLKYKIFGYMKGTQDEISTSVASEASGTYYLNSDTYDLDAYKLGNPTKFDQDKINGNGLRFIWDISECWVEGYDPDIDGPIRVDGDVILFSYYKENDSTLYRKSITLEKDEDGHIIDMEGQIPLWEVAKYKEIRFTVLNSESNAFPSSTLTLSDVDLKFFDSGNGTRKSPFVIKDNGTYTAEQQLGLIYWLPEMYFELGQDIKLSDLGVGATSNFPVPTNINDEDVSAIYKKLELTGGICGNGFTISNVTVGSNATSFGWWNSIIGGDVAENEKIEKDVKFLNKTGIINNVKIEVYEINVTSLGSDLAEDEKSYNGIFTRGNYGYIVNCELDGADIIDRHDADEKYIPVIQGNVSRGYVYIGGFAGIVGVRAVEGDNYILTYEGNGTIENCTNYLNLSLESSVTDAYKTYVGGIAGENYAGMIIDCKNGIKDISRSNEGTITGYYAGGIVATTSGYSYQDSENKDIPVYPYVVGCVNYGKVISNMLLNTQDTVYSAGGGIVGFVEKGFVTYSINYGEVTTEGRGACLGGIVGSQSTGAYILNNINLGTITYNEIYSDTGLATAVKVGSLVGYIEDGNLWNSWSIKDCITRNNADNTETTGDSTYGELTKGTARNISTTVDFKTLSEEDLNKIFNDTETGINQMQIMINGSKITAIYERLDGNAPKFTCTEGEDPVINWAKRQIVVEAETQ